MNFKIYWEQLKSRERLLLIGASGCLFIFALYLLVWEPVVVKAERLQGSIKRQQALVAWMEQAASDVKRLQAEQSSQRPKSSRGQSLLGVIDRTAKQQRLSMKRVEPDGGNRVRVSLENVSFDSTMRWLENVQSKHGIQVLSAVMDRENTPGLVNVRLVFEGTR